MYCRLWRHAGFTQWLKPDVPGHRLLDVLLGGILGLVVGIVIAAA